MTAGTTAYVIGYGISIESGAGDLNVSSVSANVNISTQDSTKNITLTVSGGSVGVILSNTANGGMGTLTVDADNHLYWNGTYLA